MSDFQVLGICGSLRAKSYNLSALKAAGELMPEGMKLRIISLMDIPFYNQDVHDKGWPEPVQRFRKDILEADALLIASPEYNYSVGGVLKNALDWASRGTDQPFPWKPLLIMSATSGPLGGARSQHDLRKILVGLGVMSFPKPEIYIGNSASKFDAEGRLTDEPTRKLLGDTLKQYKDFVGRIKKAAA